MGKIERCYGIPTGFGYFAGAGVSGKTQELDDAVKNASERLSSLYNVDVVIRFNSDRRSGGAYIKDGKRDCSVGISAKLVNPELKAMDFDKLLNLSNREYQAYLDAADKIEIGTCIFRDFLKEESPFILSDTEFRDFDSIEEAVKWLQEGTNEKLQEYIGTISLRDIQ